MNCRGDAAPSTSTERSKVPSEEAQFSQQAAQQTKQSLVIAAAPFAFQQTTPGPHWPQAEQLTPMLHHRQHAPTTDEVPHDAAHPEAASMQAPLPQPILCEEQLRSAQAQINPLPLTLSNKTPAADKDHA